MTLGAVFAQARHFSLIGAIGAAGTAMWGVTTSTISGLGRALTSAKARSHLSSIVGITEQAVAAGPVYGFVILGLVSMILGVMNLLPFLPLDGGHVLWSVSEKLRGARVSTATMWRFSSIGIVLMSFLVISAVLNNIHHAAGG
jgi:regulator of sigma E protease